MCSGLLLRELGLERVEPGLCLLNRCSGRLEAVPVGLLRLLGSLQLFGHQCCVVICILQSRELIISTSAGFNKFVSGRCELLEDGAACFPPLAELLQFVPDGGQALAGGAEREGGARQVLAQLPLGNGVVGVHVHVGGTCGGVG